MKAHSKLQLTLEQTGAGDSDPCAVGYLHISSDSSIGSSYTRVQLRIETVFLILGWETAVGNVKIQFLICRWWHPQM